MPSILFIVDIEEGHVFPCFGLAHELADAGHDIRFISVADNEGHIRDQGFAFQAVCGQQYPAGSRGSGKIVHQPEQGSSFHLLDMLFDGEIEDILKKTRPDLVIMTTFLSLEALLLHYRCGIRPVIFTPYLVAENTPVTEAYYKLIHQPLSNLIKIFGLLGTCGQRLPLEGRLQELVAPLNNVIELIACPAELDLSEGRRGKNVFHTGPGIRRLAEDWPLKAYLADESLRKKILYFSMGSQAGRSRQRRDRIMTLLMKIMEDAELENFHLVISGGDEIGQPVSQPGGNVTIYRWAPQPEVLQISAVAIIHGGLGAVKECIWFGVPMVVLPDGYDQPGNADKVVHHALGVREDIDGVTPQRLKEHILHLSGDTAIKTNVRRMQAVFKEKAQEKQGTRVIENILSR